MLTRCPQPGIKLNGIVLASSDSEQNCRKDLGQVKRNRRGLDTGDVTTLANPDVVDQIWQEVQGTGPVVKKEGPEDLKRFGEVEG